MGMFDTISGEVKCNECDGVIYYEDQTKSYDCCLFNYTLGDILEHSGTGLDKYSMVDCQCSNCENTKRLGVFTVNDKFVAVLTEKQAAKFQEKLDKVDLTTITFSKAELFENPELFLEKLKKALNEEVKEDSLDLTEDLINTYLQEVTSK